MLDYSPLESPLSGWQWYLCHQGVCDSPSVTYWAPVRCQGPTPGTLSGQTWSAAQEQWIWTSSWKQSGTRQSGGESGIICEETWVPDNSHWRGCSQVEIGKVVGVGHKWISRGAKGDWVLGTEVKSRHGAWTVAEAGQWRQHRWKAWAARRADLGLASYCSSSLNSMACISLEWQITR